MKAVEIHHTGGPEELKYEDAPKPTINPDDVLVRVFASGVNPVDWKMRKGAHGGGKGPFPRILGWDFSGVIEQTGAKVKGWKAGDEVYGRPDLNRNGTYAEYVAVRANEISRKPTSIDHKAASGVALAGLTAWQGLFQHGGLRAGQRVLIHGASGGVGVFAVQFAKWKEAYVIGTASGKNVPFVSKLGADEMVDSIMHELSETVSDPDLNAWYTSNGSENGDLCDYNYGTWASLPEASNGAKYNATWGGHHWLIQLIWKNTATPGCAAH